MAAEGWVVFQPDYRGSDNLGNTHIAAIIGDAGAGPGRDVMSGVALLRKRPYIDPEHTAVTGWSQSPITYATKIKTPTLVMSNMEDFRVPPTQAFQLYRAMKDNRVETEFIGFKGRTHASGDPVNSRERARLWVDWVKRHLGQTAATP